METPTIEDAGGIKLPESGRYVVHVENFVAVVDASLQLNAKLSVIGKTSSSPGAALIVAIEERTPEEKSAEDFFANPPSTAGLSQALMDVVDRRS